jgi:sugar phosphate permease
VPFYRGWSVVIACGIIAAFSWGLGFYGLGVYLHALNHRHGWSTGLISVAVTLYYALSAGCLVVVGGVIDRHGPRGVLTYGVLAMAAGVALLGLITAPWQLFAVYVLMATGWSCLGSTGLSSTLLPWFGRRQGLALTLALTGASVGGMVLVPVLVALVQRHGFRFATAAVSVALLAIGLPLVWLVIGGRPTPVQVAAELRRDGGDAPERAATREATVRTRQAVLRVPRLWTLMVPFALALAAQVGFLVHQISVLEPALGESRAALTVSATTVAALLGRIAIGLLSDRVDLRKLSAVNIGAQGAALAVMAAVVERAGGREPRLRPGRGQPDHVPAAAGARGVRPALVRHRVRPDRRGHAGRRGPRPGPDGPAARRAGELPDRGLRARGAGRPRRSVIYPPQRRAPWPRKVPGS